MTLAKRQDAPGELELVREFVNTWDLKESIDALATAQDVERWLSKRELLGPTGKVDGQGLAHALELREALRQLALANNGMPLGRSAVGALDRACQRATLNLRFLADGTLSLQPQASDGDGVVGRLLIIVSRSMAEGTWRRLKACPSEGCLWAFYDRSKNGLGRWCQMAECGNREKVRNYRQRQRQPVGAQASGRPLSS
jgi:predicted RNA-binding Zn ribbon-like protein